MIEVQLLGPDDWRLWRQLRLEALEESVAAFSSTLAQWTGPQDTEECWRARLSNVPLNIVVRSNGAPAGMVSAYVRTDDIAELISMWVAPFARGRGVGDAAVRAVLGWAKPREVVLSVRPDNMPAMALYQRHGFVDAGQSPDGADERLMRLPAHEHHRPPATIHSARFSITFEAPEPAQDADRFHPPQHLRQ